MGPYETCTPFDCDDGYGNWWTAWSEMKKKHCCDKESKGCDEDFDCESGSENWWRSWSDMKIKHCCHEEGKDCGAPTEAPTVSPTSSPTTAPTEAFDCSIGYETWKGGWSEKKKKYCCDQESKGCDEGFDCEYGYENWKSGWSDLRKKYCCEEKGKGCEVTESPTSSPNDPTAERRLVGVPVLEMTQDATAAELIMT